MNNKAKKIWHTFPLVGMMLIVAACGGGAANGLSATVETSDFIAMAKAARCSDFHNRLFLIDQKNVFWDVAGNCPDASYSHILFGQTPKIILCSTVDSIIGPRTSCNDESSRNFFTIIDNNRDKADLGLGTSHQVQQIVF